MNKLFIAISMIVLATSANAFPTKVKLTDDANYLMTEGESVTLFTNKGKIEFSTKSPLYNFFSTAKKGQCFILETDSESTADFNKGMDKSMVNTVTKTSCK